MNSAFYEFIKVILKIAFYMKSEKSKYIGQNQNIQKLCQD